MCSEHTILPVVANARDWCAFRKQDTSSEKIYDITDKFNFRKGRAHVSTVPK